MSDFDDLPSAAPIPPAVRFNVKTGQLFRSVYDEITGERGWVEIELGTPDSVFALDLWTRERGYGRIGTGLYEMIFSPVGSAPPPPPSGEHKDEYNQAMGFWLFNPKWGLVRFESITWTCQRIFLALFNRCYTFDEARQGLDPIISFADRRECFYKKHNSTGFEPVVLIKNWVDRNKIEAFRIRQPTVALPAPPPVFPPLPPPASVQVPPRPRPEDFGPNGPKRQASPKPPETKSKAKPKSALAKELDDEIPDDPIADLWAR